MLRAESKGERMAALFLLGLLALSPPFLAIFAVETLVFGIPLLYVYLFAVWGLLILLLALLSHGDGERSASDAERLAREL